MAIDGFAPSYAPPRSLSGGTFAAIAFTALLLMVFVGLEPFQPPVAVSAYGGVTSGDALRQVCYILVFGVIVIAAIQQRGLSVVRSLPPAIILLLLWCLISALWATQPDIVLRRAGLEVVIVLSIFLSVETLGAERAFGIWKWLLAAVLVVNFLSIPLIPAARHLANEIDPGLIGDWRGLYGHKNIAGAVCVMTILLFLFSRNGRGNWIGLVVAGLGAAFLVMTHSKSSLGFLPLALMAALTYRLASRDGLSRAIACIAATILLLGLGLFAILDAGAIAHVLEDPTEFTGRAAIWQAELAYIRDHLLLGAGFGTFADTGGLSPLHNYVSSSWVEAVSHGHNGYLQLLVTIGGIGFVLALIGLVLSPLARFWTLDPCGGLFRPLLFGLFVFLILHNVMESDFLEGDGAAWAALLMVIAALRNPAQDESLTKAA